VTQNEPTVVDNPGGGRFEVVVDEHVAGYAEYRRTKDTIAFTPAVTDPAFEGRGLGSLLTRGALDSTRQGGHAVLPFCPFLRTYLERHPALDLGPAGRRSEFGLAPATAEPARP
jgi:predicted GNAT family acetyltransferase